MDGKQRIYAVDDEEAIRELYRYALEDAGFEAVCFPDGQSLLDAVQKQRPDLVLLDIMLDGMDGYEILGRLRRGGADFPVIMVSAKGSEIDKVKGLNLGADDYLAKPFGVLELIARIRANLRRGGTAEVQVLSCHGLVMDEARHEIRVNGVSVPATAKEYGLLRVLLRNRGTVLSRDRILDAVWGENYGETRTLDLHIAQVRRLIQGSGAEIKTVRSVGYMLE